MFGRWREQAVEALYLIKCQSAFWDVISEDVLLEKNVLRCYNNTLACAAQNDSLKLTKVLKCAEVAD